MRKKPAWLTTEESRKIEMNGLERIKVPPGTLVHIAGLPFAASDHTELIGVRSNYELALINLSIPNEPDSK